MSAWGEMRKRSSGEILRKEDMVMFWKYASFRGILSPETEKMLSDIYSFKEFAPFLPSDILVEDGQVKVFLDEEDVREVNVPLDKIIEARDLLIKEVKHLEQIFDKLRNSKKPDQEMMGKLEKKIARLRKRIEKLNDIIRKAIAAGKSCWSFIVEVYGRYWRDEKTDNHGIYSKSTKAPEIHLMMRGIERLSKEWHVSIEKMTGIIFVHELMHAFFDKHDPYVNHPDYNIIEEPIAEYGMLCFMEMFERCHPEYKGIVDTAKDFVESKQYGDGVCHYGFGRFLFDDKVDFCVDWVSLFRLSWPSLIIRHEERQVYGSLISEIRYPNNERFCESMLFDVLKPRRFFFSGIKSVWDKNGEEELYFTVNAKVARSLSFMVEYPRGVKVHITFRDKALSNQFEGEATIVLNDTRFYIKDDLLNKYATVFGKTDHRPFAFYEEKPSDGIHPAEWIAIEL